MTNTTSTTETSYAETKDPSHYYFGVEIRPCAWQGPNKWYIPNGTLDEKLCRRFQTLTAAKEYIKYNRQDYP